MLETLETVCKLLILEYCGGARGVMVIVVGNGHGDTSSKPRRDWLHCINTLGKGMNPIILPPAMGKIVGQTR